MSRHKSLRVAFESLEQRAWKQIEALGRFARLRLVARDLQNQLQANSFGLSDLAVNRLGPGDLTNFEFIATFNGDSDGDLDVDFADFLTLSANFGKSDAVLNEGGTDGNGTVDFADFLTLSQNFGRSYRQ